MAVLDLQISNNPLMSIDNDGLLYVNGNYLGKGTITNTTYTTTKSLELEQLEKRIRVLEDKVNNNNNNNDRKYKIVMGE